MEENNSFVKCQKPQPQHWTNFAIGRSYFYLTARINTRDKEIGVYLNILGPNKQDHFTLLNDKHKQEIESRIEFPVHWRELPEAKESHIETSMKADPMDRNDWENQHKWLRATLEKFHKVFSPIVKKL